MSTEPTYTPENPLVVVLPNSRWLRGEGSPASRLLRGADNKQCCIGLACSALGMANSAIGEMVALWALIELKNLTLPEPLATLAKQGLEEMDAPINKAYGFNDREPRSDEERITLINEQVNPFGLHFVFDPEG